MSDDLTPADEGAEPGDLTARLRSLEERISSEGAVAPARRRRTPPNPAQRYVPPPLADDDPLAGALDETPPAPQPEPQAVASAPQETAAEEPERTPEPKRRAPVKKAAPRTATPRKAVPVAELGSGDVAAAAIAAASTPAVKKARKAAAKKTAAPMAPAKAPVRGGTGRAPAKRTATGGATEPAPWPVADTAALAMPPAPLPAAVPATSPRKTSVVKPDLSKATVVAPELPPPPSRPAAVPTAGRTVEVATTAPVAELVVPARKGDLLVRVLLTLTVLLLAAAAGLGAAAFVENRDATYNADVVVRLDPGNDPQGSIDAALLAGMTRYTNQVGSHVFTLTAAQRAAVSEADLRTDVRATQIAARQLRLTVQASTSAGTQALANGAGDALVELVNLDQASHVTSPGDRLSAAVERSAGVPNKTSPKDRDAYAAGGLAAGAVLLLSGVGALLRFTRSS